MKLKRALLTSKFLALSMAGAVMFSCSSGGGSGNTGAKPRVGAQYYGNVRLGLVEGATVEIYEIGADGKPVLKWTETSDANGKFNSHAGELDPNKLYLYIARGGQDWDANNDGVRDATPTPNKGKLRALAKGEDIIAAGNNFSLSPVSEVVAEKVLPDLTKAANEGTYDPDTINNELDVAAQDIIGDINGDSTVDNVDALMFNPADNNNLAKVEKPFNGHINDLANDIRNGKLALLAADPVIDDESTTADANAAAISDDGKYAYVLTNSGLEVFDASDPENLTAGSTATVSTSDKNDIKSAPNGEYAYVAGGDKVSMIDLDDNGNGVKDDPAEKATASTPGTATALDVVTDGTYDYVVVADGTSGVGLFKGDQSAPSLTAIGGDEPTGSSSNAKDVAASQDGQYAYVADEDNGLVTFKIDPTDSDSSGHYLDLTDTDSTSAYGNARAVAVSPNGDYVYVATYDTGGKAYLLTYSIASDKSNPTFVKAEPLPGYLNDNSEPVDIAVSSDKGKLYVADSGNGLIELDISDQSNPEVDGFVNTDGTTKGVTLKDNGKFAIVADGSGGVKSIATTLIQPIVLGIANTYSTVDLAETQDKRYILVADGYCGLRSVNVEDPTAPDVRNGCGWNTGRYANSVAIDDAGHIAYVAGAQAGVEVYDISTIDSPSLNTSISVVNSGDACNDENRNCDAAHDVYLDKDNNLLYVAEGTAGLRIFDTTSLSQRGRLDPDSDTTETGSSNDIRTVEPIPGEQKVLIGDYKANAVEIVDVSNPSSPNIVATINVNGLGQQDSIAIHGNYVYVAAAGYGIKVIDLNTNSVIKTLDYRDPGDTDPMAASAIKLSTDGKVAFVSDQNRGLIILDLSNPTDPAVLGTLNTPGKAYSAVIDGDTSIAYVANFYKGMILMDVASFK